MSNFRHIVGHLVFWSSNVKSDDVTGLLDLENHKVDTSIGSLPVIELELWSFKCQISAILAATLFPDRSMLNLMTSLDPDLENHKVDTNIRSLVSYNSRYNHWMVILVVDKRPIPAGFNANLLWPFGYVLLSATWVTIQMVISRAVWQVET